MASENLVCAPGHGMVPESVVWTIPPGWVVVRQDEHDPNSVVFLDLRKQVQQLPTRTREGQIWHDRRQEELGSDKTFWWLPKQPVPGAGAGWQCFVQYQFDNQTQFVGALDGYFTVPGEPANASSATNYVFCGMATSDTILQPVMQTLGGSGSTRWSIQDYLVSNSMILASDTRVNVNAGTQYYAVMGKNLSNWWYNCHVLDSTKTTWITTGINTGGGYHFFVAYAGVYESYNVTSCRQRGQTPDAQFDPMYLIGWDDSTQSGYYPTNLWTSLQNTYNECGQNVSALPDGNVGNGGGVQVHQGGSSV